MYAVNLAVRVRTPLRPTDPGFELIPQRFQRTLCHATSPTSLAIDAPQGRKLFEFDRVFGEDVQQEGVWDYVNESIESFVQGYNVSVLAYGQSGSGKSYTMGTSGPAEQSDSRFMGMRMLLSPQNPWNSSEKFDHWLIARYYRAYSPRCWRTFSEATRTASITTVWIVCFKGAYPIFDVFSTRFLAESCWSGEKGR